MDETPPENGNQDGTGREIPAAATPPAAAAPAAASAAAAPSEETLKAAYKAFKKRLKIKQLDHDSRVGRAPTSSGSTKIAGIEPPDQYPKAVWDALVEQKKLRYSGHGMYEMR
ncbi:MAG: hypothetical protein K8U03_26995 [Planctomycetia bacterium]|nr:hypothetical protein [Planctomycetia bacterium]